MEWRQGLGLRPFPEVQSVGDSGVVRRRLDGLVVGDVRGCLSVLLYRLGIGVPLMRTDQVRCRCCVTKAWHTSEP
jgi:hypothetical protein